MHQQLCELATLPVRPAYMHRPAPTAPPQVAVGRECRPWGSAWPSCASPNAGQVSAARPGPEGRWAGNLVLSQVHEQVGRTASFKGRYGLLVMNLHSQGKISVPADSASFNHPNRVVPRVEPLTTLPISITRHGMLTVKALLLSCSPAHLGRGVTATVPSAILCCTHLQRCGRGLEPRVHLLAHGALCAKAARHQHLVPQPPVAAGPAAIHVSKHLRLSACSQPAHQRSAHEHAAYALWVSAVRHSGACMWLNILKRYRSRWSQKPMHMPLNALVERVPAAERHAGAVRCKLLSADGALLRHAAACGGQQQVERAEARKRLERQALGAWQLEVR